ncbi:ABC transporter ATP-binding protein [Tissierella sp.]|uniref:ABC transporter ATP-binding protein n=1 Tax=Tissierella sp. TaxID=41274 RepID=UPI00285B92C5|nr:ABC transporter ATP-binding protein [Tissierella sp.]MDR7857366.1 ABC transporter ATP-binding protein [Tissierella sp.]
MKSKFKLLPLFLKDVSKDYKFMFPLTVVKAIFEGLHPLINIIIPKYILDELINAKRIDVVGKYIIILALGNLIFKIIISISKHQLEIYSSSIYYDVSRRIGVKASKIDIQVMERKSTLDLFERARYGSYNIQSFIESISMTIASIITIISTIGILVSNDWRLILVIIISNILTILCFNKIKELDIDFEKRNAPLNRKYGYFANIANDFRFAKDIRLYKANKFLLYKAKEVMDGILKINFAYMNKHGFFSGIAQAIVQVQIIITFILLSISLVGKKITVGSFTMLYGAANQLGNSFKNLIEAYTSLITLGYNIEPYYEFLALEEVDNNDLEEKHVGESITIEFKNVSFKYPNREDYVFENLSFKVSPKETLAIVGKNGAGKTTIIKLICRLYKPQEGKIYINGIDIEEFPTDQYRKFLGVVFQDFKLIPVQVCENIMCKKDDEINESDVKIAWEKLEETGIKQWLKNQSSGLKSYITKIYDKNGLLPSGGQEQKIAISRALAKEGHIIILDEPTAALDPKSEEEVFENLIKLTKGKTSLFISHRLSSTRIADRIIVLDKGKIIEEGDHNQLINEDGLYANMYKIQARQYI